MSICVSVVYVQSVRVYIFPESSRPTFRDLLQRVGPAMIWQRNSTMLFDDLDCPLSQLCSRRFVARPWCDSDVRAHRAIFLAQIRATRK